MRYASPEPARVPVREFLKEQRRRTLLANYAMTLVHDLDGALAARQAGLAWFSQEKLLVTAIQVWLMNHGEVDSDSVMLDSEKYLMTLAKLEALDSRLALAAWELLERPLPDDGSVLAEVGRTRSFVATELELESLTVRTASVGTWAHETDDLRTIAATLGIAQDDRWYLNDSDEGDWFSNALGYARAEEPQPGRADAL